MIFSLTIAILTLAAIASLTAGLYVLVAGFQAFKSGHDARAMQFFICGSAAIGFGIIAGFIIWRVL